MSVVDLALALLQVAAAAPSWVWVGLLAAIVSFGTVPTASLCLIQLGLRHQRVGADPAGRAERPAASRGGAS